MNDLYEILKLRSLKATRNAISSLVSAGGVSRCALQDGRTIRKYGQAVAPANLSALPLPTFQRCPCQPFSVAGKGKAQSDERHLWPDWFKLIQERRPTTIFGEQVSGAITHGWLDDVYQRLEAEGYAVGSAVLPACGVGAPHKRDRLWFVAESPGADAAGQHTDGRGIGRDKEMEKDRPITYRHEAGR